MGNRNTTRIGDLLRDADPLRDEDSLTAAQTGSMRRFVVAAARRAGSAALSWTEPLAIGAVLGVMILAGITTGRHLTVPRPPRSAAVEPTERRQLQFATAGGTRIIWIFDSEFSVKEAAR
jgi:hypothetical protein